VLGPETAVDLSAAWMMKLVHRVVMFGAVGGVLGLLFVLSLAKSSPPVPSASPPVRTACDRSATPLDFASELSAAKSRQTICLSSGDYGTFGGTDKAVTIRAADGATPTMQLEFGAGDRGFTLDGLSGLGGIFTDGARHITIKNSAFTSAIRIGGRRTDGIVLDHNTHNWDADSSATGENAKIYLEGTLSGTLASPSVTIKRSQITNGDLDGIHFGGGSGYQIVGNRFANLCQRNSNHTDNMQFDSTRTSRVRIARNYVYAARDCPTQGITSYDAGTQHVIIEDNVVDVPRDWGIELYSDRNSIVRHNTVVWHDKSYSMFNTETGQITIDHKDGEPASTGTEVYDNIVTKVNFNDGSDGTAKDNLSGRRVRFVGPTDTYAGFRLASGSRFGREAATDGHDVGVRTEAPTARSGG
jgi:hypothetical protein